MKLIQKLILNKCTFQNFEILSKMVEMLSNIFSQNLCNKTLHIWWHNKYSKGNKCSTKNINGERYLFIWIKIFFREICRNPQRKLICFCFPRKSAISIYILKAIYHITEENPITGWNNIITRHINYLFSKSCSLLYVLVCRNFLIKLEKITRVISDLYIR